MIKIIPLDAIDKTYVNPILNRVVKDLMHACGVSSDTRILHGEESVKNWNAGSLENREMDGNRELVTFTDSDTNTNIGSLKLMDGANVNYPLFSDRRVGIYVKPVYTKVEKILTIRLETVSKTTAVRVRNYILLRQKKASRVLTGGRGTYSIPDYIVDFFKDVNTLKNIQRPEQVSDEDYIASAATHAIKLTTNSSGQMDSLVGSEVQKTISVKFGTEKPQKVEYDKDTSLHSFEFEITIDFTKPTDLELKHEIMVYNTLLPKKYIGYEPLYGRVEDYVYYRDIIISMVYNKVFQDNVDNNVEQPAELVNYIPTEDGFIDGILIDYPVVSGIVVDGPFKDVNIGYDYTGQVTGVLVNNVIYGGLMDGIVLDNFVGGVYFNIYDESPDWNVESGIIIGGVMNTMEKDLSKEIPDLSFIDGVVENDIIVGGQLAGIELYPLEETIVVNPNGLEFISKLGVRPENSSTAIDKYSECLTIPPFDTPTHLHEIDDHQIFLTAIITVTDEKPNELLNINELGIYTLDDELLNIITTSIRYDMFYSYRTPFLVIATCNGVRMSPNDLSFDAVTGSITFKEPLDKMNRYRVSFYMLTDYSYLFDTGHNVKKQIKNLMYKLNVLRLVENQLVVKQLEPSDLGDMLVAKTVMISAIQVFAMSNKNVLKENGWL